MTEVPIVLLQVNVECNYGSLSACDDPERQYLSQSSEGNVFDLFVDFGCFIHLHQLLHLHSHFAKP